MNLLTIVLTATCVLLSFTASAGEGGKQSEFDGDRYIGIMVASPHYKDDDSNASFRSQGLLLRGGVVLNDFFGVEGRFGLFSEDSGGDESYQIDYTASIYARADIPLIPRVPLYVLAGATRFSGDVPGFSDVNETGFSYGLGIELYGNQKNALTVEWMRFAIGDIHNNDYTLESATIGFLHRF